jgi:hypothetical protein
MRSSSFKDLVHWLKNVQSQEYQDTGELLALVLEVLAVHLRLLQLGPSAAILEPHFHLPRPEAQAVRKRNLLLLHSTGGRTDRSAMQISYTLRYSERETDRNVPE